MVVLSDSVEGTMRKVRIDAEQHKVVKALKDTRAYLSHTKYSNHHTTITLSTDKFIQAVDIFISHKPVDEEKSFEYYFSGSQNVEREEVTSVILHPYVERKELSKETGRDYLSEMDLCVEYIIEKCESRL